MSIFNIIKSKQTPEGYFIFSDQPEMPQETKVYSEKSLIRESRQINLAIESLPDKKKILWIAPFHDKIYSNINYKNKIKWICPVIFHRENGNLPVEIIHGEERLNYFLNQLTASDSFLLMVHPTLLPFGFDSLSREILKKAAIRLKTIQHFSSIWENNFKKNKLIWITKTDISKIKTDTPDLFLLGGPEIDTYHEKISKASHIWAADTALPILAFLKKKPDLVFSLDAGFGSLEHFILSDTKQINRNISVVLDPLSFPYLFNAGFSEVYSYTHSNPLLAGLPDKFTKIVNQSSDVYGLMVGVFNKLFGKILPEVIGHDGRHKNYVTHYRGSAYHFRQYFYCNRLTTPEKYFFHLSSRYQ